MLKGTHLPLTIKEIQAGYLTAPFLKDIYQFLAQNKLLSKRNAMHKSRNTIRKVYLTGFLTVQADYSTGQTEDAIGNT